MGIIATVRIFQCNGDIIVSRHNLYTLYNTVYMIVLPGYYLVLTEGRTIIFYCNSSRVLCYKNNNSLKQKEAEARQFMQQHDHYVYK